jgi:hypothetical protein
VARQRTCNMGILDHMRHDCDHCRLHLLGYLGNVLWSSNDEGLRWRAFNRSGARRATPAPQMSVRRALSCKPMRAGFGGSRNMMLSIDAHEAAVAVR